MENKISPVDTIKLTFDYTQSFFAAKSIAFLIYYIISLLASFLLYLGPVGEIFLFLLSLVSSSFLFYIGNLASNTRDNFEFFNILKTKSILNIFFDKMIYGASLVAASGALIIILFISYSLVLGYSGFLEAYKFNKLESSFDTAMLIAVLFVIITMFIIGYVLPIVYGKIYSSQKPSDVFLYMFEVLSFSLWKKAFSFRYMVSFFLWSMYVLMYVLIIYMLSLYPVLGFIALLLGNFLGIQFVFYSIFVYKMISNE